MIRKKEKRRSSGVIITFLNFLSRSIIKGLSGGFFGKLFTSYDKMERKARNGVVLGALTGVPGGRKNSVSRMLMKWHDESVGIKLIRKAIGFLTSSRLNLYGTYLATFGLYSTLIVLLEEALRNGGALSIDVLAGANFWSSIVVFLASIPLLVSTSSLLSVVGGSLIMRGVLEDGAGIPDNKFEEKLRVNNKHSYFVAIIAGILTGGLTYLVSPVKIVLAIVFACLIGLILNFPEMGVVSAIFLAPYLGFFDNSSTMLLIIVGITAISYIFKVAVGRRTFTVRLVDLFVILLAVMLFAGGIVTSGGEASLNAALMYTGLLVMYFLVVNLMNTKEWLNKCITAIAAPSMVIAVLGIIEYASGSMPSQWIDSDMFSDISNRAVATFDNPNMLATYLILTAPFIWVHMRNKEFTVSGRIISGIGSLASIVCVVLTWSRGGWLGMIAAIIVFLLINYKHTFKYFLVLGLSSPVWIAALPDSVIRRFTSIGSLADSSTYYRLFTWKGSLKMLAEYYPGGIGVGESAFAQIYPLYSYIGTETTVHSHNLYLELALELGVIGLVVFAFIMFMVVQRGFGCIKYNSENRLTVAFVSAALSGLVAAFVHGMFDHIWYNYRVFFMFWVVAALLCAFANVYPKKNTVVVKNYNADEAASLDIIFGEKSN